MKSGEYSVGGLGITLAALLGDAVTGDVVGFTADASALLSGYASDAVVLWKANKEMELLLEEQRLQTRLLEKKLFQMKEDKRHEEMAEIERDLKKAQEDMAYISARLDSMKSPEPWTIYHPNWDPDTGSWKKGTRQWKEEEELKKKLQAKLRKEKKSEPSAEDWKKFNEDMAKIRVAGRSRYAEPIFEQTQQVL